MASADIHAAIKSFYSSEVQESRQLVNILLLFGEEVQENPAWPPTCRLEEFDRLFGKHLSPAWSTADESLPVSAVWG